MRPPTPPRMGAPSGSTPASASVGSDAPPHRTVTATATDARSRTPPPRRGKRGPRAVESTKTEKQGSETQTPPDTPRAAAAAAAPAREAGKRERARRDWEDDPLTQAEIEEMKTRFVDDVNENITDACQLFPPHQNWSRARIERDRLDKINMRQDEEEGRIATLVDLNRLRAKNVPPPSFALTECVLGLLRTG